MNSLTYRAILEGCCFDLALLNEPRQFEKSLPAHSVIFEPVMTTCFVMRPPDMLSIGVVVGQASGLGEDGNIIDQVMVSR